MPKVSIITTFYNSSGTLMDSIMSIINSNFENFEIVLVDDGSVDGSYDIANAVNDKRLQLFKPGRIGRAAALNYGLKKSKGEYIAILDADDICMQTRLSKQVYFLDNNPRYSLVCGNAELVDIHQRKIGSTNFPESHSELVECLLNLNPFPHSSVMYRREAAVNAGGYNTRCEKSIDYNFYLSLLSSGVYFFGINESLIQLRSYENSWGKNDANALQMRYGIIGLINYYQIQNNTTGILQLNEQHWKEVKCIYNHWFDDMNFQRKIQAKHLIRSAKDDVIYFNFIKAFMHLKSAIKLDPWLWKYRGCNFSYPMDVKLFINYYECYFSKNELTE